MPYCTVRERFRRPVMRALIEGISHEHLLDAEEVGRIQCPTLFLWGKSERILPPSGLEFFRGALPPHVRIEEPEGWAHSPYLERPSEVVHKVLEFMRALDAQERAAVPEVAVAAGS